MPLSCIGCFRYTYKIHGCRCPELAGISISEVGVDVSSMNKVFTNRPRFLPQDAMKHVDVQC